MECAPLGSSGTFLTEAPRRRLSRTSSAPGWPVSRASWSLSPIAREPSISDRPPFDSYQMAVLAGSGSCLSRPPDDNSVVPPVYNSGAGPVVVNFSSTDESQLQRWDLLDGGGQIVDTSTDTTFPFSAPRCESATYTIRQVSTDDSIVDQPFRLDWTIAAAMSFDPPSGVGSVRFSDSSDVPECITQRSNELGLPGVPVGRRQRSMPPTTTRIRGSTSSL